MEQTRIDLKKADNDNTRTEQTPGEVRISVRGLVEFVLRHGDIDNRHHGSPENAMQEGSRIHRMIQRRMGADYQAEVSLRYTFPTEQYTLTVEGRADGIIENAEGVTVDEIKGTYRDLSRMREPEMLHVAQAKCYAYFYCLQKELKEIRIRMTYCNLESEDIRYFFEDYTFVQLERWFEGLIKEYRKWADYTWQWKQIRRQSIERLEFPFPYREGQRDLVANVYRTIYHGRKLFLEAPTGVGKTISALFPAVKAMGQGMGDRIFYLTAKTITRTVADDTVELLRERGLRFKSVTLTAKEKICFLERPECNPQSCPYAKGHYDRINEAVYALLVSKDRFSREVIEEYAVKHQVCPFEFCLDMSLFADAIIGDYNYLFDPHVYLKRFFAEASGGDYLFLIDEAHNLVERGREMYSASLVKEDFLSLKREIQQTIMSEMEEKNRRNQVSGQMTMNMTGMSNSMNVSEMTFMTEMLPASGTSDSMSTGMSAGKGRGRRQAGRSILLRQGYGEKLQQRLERCNKELLKLKRECENYRLVESIDDFVNALMRLYSTMSDYLEEQEESELPVRERILEFYFEVSHFLMIYERVDEHYVKYTQMQEDGEFLIKLFCVNPSENLKECMGRGRSSILFSATFLPIQYYKELLGGEAEDYEVYAKSVFDQEKRALLIADDVTSKYSRRSDEEYERIVRYIDEIVRNRHGNYMVFCPSYSFMQRLYDLYEERFADEEKECILQQEFMSEEDREAFLGRFRGEDGPDLQRMIQMEIEELDHTLIAFCVLGGIFGEGIDLKKDSLIGVIIVGTGIPQVCNEREILKNYFDERNENGFDYAYRYPGMNKVLQAAGRVIRTEEDVGIIALLDERFLQMSNRRLFPREWEYFEKVNVDSIAKRVERFWDSWL